jgi:para-nitrobenzyl esterase
MAKALALFALFWFAVGCAGSGVREDPGTARQIQDGKIVGGATSQGALAWLGIPYAKPPVGALRWRAPQRPEPWTGVFEATNHGSLCPQFAGIQVDAPEGTVVGDEDCLHLNVWAPAEPKVSKRRGLPVMVWIHGGGNTVGGGSLHDGSRLAGTQNVVVVTLNYRLGPLGWFRHAALRAEAAGEEEASGNFALLDLVQALQWVQVNIDQFGGNPDNVTVFGESAGARNILMLMRSPLAGGLFHRAIAQSGGFLESTPAQAENLRDDPEPGHINSSGELLVRLHRGETGVAREDARARVGEMSLGAVREWARAIDPERLLRTYVEEGETGFGMLEIPQEFSDGHALPAAAALDVFERGDFHRVPLLLGSNRDEMKLWMAFDPVHVGGLRDLRSTTIRDAERYELVASYLSRAWKAEAVDEIARRVHAHQPDSLFAYRFDWDEQGQRLFSNVSRLLGAAHGLDVPFTFGVWELGDATDAVFTRGNRAGREELAAAMMSYWTEFAYEGDPGQGRAGTLPHWEPFDPAPEHARLLLLDTQEGGGIQMSGVGVTAVSLMQELAKDRRLPVQADKCEIVRGIEPSWHYVAEVGNRRFSCRAN